MRHKIGDLVSVDKPGHSLHGLKLVITNVNGRHQFVIGKLLGPVKRSSDYRKDDELRFSGSMLEALKNVSA